MLKKLLLNQLDLAFEPEQVRASCLDISLADNPTHRGINHRSKQNIERHRQ
jgi:hypothetical protein